MTDRQAAVAAVNRADERWERALHASEFAPRDPGFVDRVREIADASEQEVFKSASRLRSDIARTLPQVGRANKGIPATC